MDSRLRGKDEKVKIFASCCSGLSVKTKIQRPSEKCFQTACDALDRLQHFYDAFAEIINVVVGQPRHIDAAGAHGIDGEFVFQTVNLFRR